MLRGGNMPARAQKWQRSGCKGPSHLPPVSSRPSVPWVPPSPWSLPSRGRVHILAACAWHHLATCPGLILPAPSDSRFPGSPAQLRAGAGSTEQGGHRAEGGMCVPAPPLGKAGLVSPSPRGLLPPTLLLCGPRNVDVKLLWKPELRAKEDGRAGRWAGARDARLPAQASAASLGRAPCPAGSFKWGPGV